jgi:hypothetical protein
MQMVGFPNLNFFENWMQVCQLEVKNLQAVYGHTVQEIFD